MSVELARTSVVADVIAVAMSHAVSVSSAGLGVTDHAAMFTTETSVPHRSAIVVISTSVIVSAVSASIVPEDGGTMVEVIPVGIVAVNGEVPSAMQPAQRREQVVDGGIGCPLPVVQYVSQVGITVSQVTAVQKVGFGANREQVVEVDFVGIVVLLLIQVQFVGHLIGQVVCLFACRFVIHCIHPRPGEDCNHHCHHVTFHSRRFY